VSYKVEFSKSATKQFRKLSPDIKKRVQAKINELAIEPRPNRVKKLQSDDRYYRIRIGDFRVVYEIKDDVLLVIVIRIKHRSEVYKNDIN
jgi:mRNA interferase RelE/StbE